MLVGERLELNKAGLSPRSLEKTAQKGEKKKIKEKERMQSSFFMGKDVKLSC